MDTKNTTSFDDKTTLFTPNKVIHNIVEKYVDNMLLSENIWKWKILRFL
jgi:hypothetical protein